MPKKQDSLLKHLSKRGQDDDQNDSGWIRLDSQMRLTKMTKKGSVETSQRTPRKPRKLWPDVRVRRRGQPPRISQLGPKDDMNSGSSDGEEIPPSQYDRKYPTETPKKKMRKLCVTILHEPEPPANKILPSRTETAVDKNLQTSPLFSRRNHLSYQELMNFVNPNEDENELREPVVNSEGISFDLQQMELQTPQKNSLPKLHGSPTQIIEYDQYGNPKGISFDKDGHIIVEDSNEKKELFLFSAEKPAVSTLVLATDTPESEYDFGILERIKRNNVCGSIPPLNIREDDEFFSSPLL